MKTETRRKMRCKTKNPLAIMIYPETLPAERKKKRPAKNGGKRASRFVGIIRFSRKENLLVLAGVESLIPQETRLRGQGALPERRERDAPGRKKKG